MAVRGLCNAFRIPRFSYVDERGSLRQVDLVDLVGLDPPSSYLTVRSISGLLCSWIQVTLYLGALYLQPDTSSPRPPYRLQIDHISVPKPSSAFVDINLHLLLNTGAS